MNCKETSGQLNAKGLKFGIVVSRFNDLFTGQLLKGALDCLARHGADEKNVEIVWVHRNGGPRGRPEALTAAAVAAAKRIDPADAYVWVACESAVARSMRSALLAARPFNPKWMKVAGYWRLGRAGSHEVIED